MCHANQRDRAAYRLLAARSPSIRTLSVRLFWRRWLWDSLERFGQVGDDNGLDIIGRRTGSWGRSEDVVIACANWRNITATKGKSDIDKMVAVGVCDGPVENGVNRNAPSDGGRTAMLTTYSRP